MTLQDTADHIWWICDVREDEEHLRIFGDGLLLLKCEKEGS